MSASSMDFGSVVERLRAEQAGKVDAVINTKDHPQIEVAEDEEGNGKLVVVFMTPQIPEISGFPHDISDWAHHQIADRAGVPFRYYRRMMEDAPGLLIENAHHWWRAEPSNQLARTIRPADISQGEVSIGQPRLRAWLSDGFRVIDNLDFVSTVLATAEEFNAEIHEAHLDEQRVYLKLTAPSLRAEVNVGEEVEAGVIVRNSEVGDGKVVVQPFARRLGGGSIIAPTGYARVHLGGRLEEGILSEEAIAAENAAIWLKVRDWVRFAFNEENLKEIVAAFQRALTVKVEVEARRAIHAVIARSDTSNEEAFGILERYLRGNDNTQAGVVSAVASFAAEKAPTYRRQVELEEQAGQILSLTDKQFTGLLEAPVSSQEIAKTFGA